MKILHWKEVLKNYIFNNYKEYILVALLFIIGLFIGVMIINNSRDEQTTEITTYINNFITNFKQAKEIKNTDLMLVSIKNNIFLSLVLWIAGTTVIGLPIVLLVILFRGAVLGVTVASITSTLGIIKGIGFSLITMLLQNILFIPAVLTLGVSSIKLYKSIIKDKRKENIKIAVIRHTIISTLMLIILIISCIATNVVSITFLKKKKY